MSNLLLFMIEFTTYLGDIASFIILENKKIDVIDHYSKLLSLYNIAQNVEKK